MYASQGILSNGTVVADQKAFGTTTPRLSPSASCAHLGKDAMVKMLESVLAVQNVPSMVTILDLSLDVGDVAMAFLQLRSALQFRA